MEEKNKAQNQRKSERKDAFFSLSYSIEKPYELRISLSLPDETGALMQNLSEIGMAIITRYNIPAGTLLRIRFNLLNLHLRGDNRLRKLEIISEVVSNTDLADGGYRIGVRFNNISEEDKVAIREFVKCNKLAF